MIKRIDLDLWKGSWLTFKDDGPVSQGAKTRLFSVFSTSNRSLLGYIKWYVNWRKYCFFPLNSLFDDNCLREIADFCKEATTVHKSRLPNKQRVKDLKKAARQRRMEKLAKKKLTSQENSGSIENVDDGSDVPVSELLEAQASVVEGKGLEPTPLEVELGTIPF